MPQLGQKPSKRTEIGPGLPVLFSGNFVFFHVKTTLMIQKIPLENILFLDIETVPEKEAFDQLSQEAQELWAEKTAYRRKEEHTPEEFYERAGIWAEFGKIICISAGFFEKSHGLTFRVRSYTGGEKELLLV